MEGKAGQIGPRRWHEAGFAPELSLQALSAFSTSPSDFTYKNKDKIILKVKIVNNLKVATAKH